MKKFPLFVATVAAVMALSAPVAYAAPSPTEPDREVDILDPDVPLDLLDIGDPDVPLDLMNIGDPDVPLDLMDIEDPDVPLSFMPAPQTGVNGLSGVEALALAAVVSSAGGAVILAKTKKQTGSVR